MKYFNPLVWVGVILGLLIFVVGKSLDDGFEIVRKWHDKA